MVVLQRNTAQQHMDDIGQRQVERIAGIATPGLATWGFHGDRRIGIGKSMKRICVDV